MSAFNIPTGMETTGSSLLDRLAGLSVGNRSGGGGGGQSDSGVGRNARANLNEFLSFLGLGSMTDWAWGMMVEGHSFNVVLQELRQRPEYQARFPAMADLRERGRAIDEGGYITLERQYTQIARTFGLPETFYDQPDDFAGFIGNEMSPVEFEDRLSLWQQVARDRAADPANAEVLQQMRNLYGISADSGDFLAMVIDPDRATTALEKRVAAARTAAAAETAGFGALSRGEAERIGSQFMGGQFGQFDREGALEGFRTLRESQELFQQLPGREGTERDFSRREQFGAVFDRSQDVLSALEDQAKERVALFRRGGSFASGREGISGLGRAD